MVHFGNTTNNRLENANGRLKKRTYHNISIQHAIQRVSNHSAALLREYELHATYHCDRREVLCGDFYVLRVVARLTTYAAAIVLRHLGRRTPDLPVTLTAEHEVCYCNE